LVVIDGNPIENVDDVANVEQVFVGGKRLI
jgi:hypothetical protein